MGPDGPICSRCAAAIRPADGHWVAGNPDSDWGDGFSMNHLVTPWLNYPDLFERQRTYNPEKFQNECLGLSTNLGDHVVTQQDVEACCDDRAAARGISDVPREFRGCLIAGIDWGGGSVSCTVLVIGYMEAVSGTFSGD